MCQTSVDDRLLQLFLTTTNDIGWWRGNCATDASQLVEPLRDQLSNSGCLLKALVCLSDSKVQRAMFAKPIRRALLNLVDAGLTLRLAWPRSWSRSIERWIGPRFYLTSAANFTSHARFASVACSQIGRHGCKLRSWPKLLDSALQHFHRHRDRPLLITGTTLNQPLEQFVERTPIQSLQVAIDNQSACAEWLRQLIDQLQQAEHFVQAEKLAQELAETVRISPAIVEPELPFAGLPLQDRLSIALPDHVMALSVREQGNVSRLLNERLIDSEFPIASVFVAAIADDSTARTPVFQQWLPRGAVGWLISESQVVKDVQGLSGLCNCKRLHNQAAVNVTRSLASSIATTGAVHQYSSDRFLVHCTRGSSGPMPDETDATYLDRAWTLGEVAEAHPILTLHRIVSEKRIVGNSRLTRTTQPCISFSAVPLEELLQRRRFRSHLGRWDWEPFGVLIRQAVLEALGARPVIYGNSAQYDSLAAADRPYFQPVGKRDKKTGLDWTSEQEWRLLGHLQLSQVQAEAVMLFVEYQQQAQQLARYSPWNIKWIKSN